MQSIHGLAIYSPESNKSSWWSLMELVHMATCSIHWAILWSTESIKIRQNQEKDFGGFGVIGVYWLVSYHGNRVGILAQSHQEQPVLQQLGNCWLYWHQRQQMPKKYQWSPETLQCKTIKHKSNMMRWSLRLRRCRSVCADRPQEHDWSVDSVILLRTVSTDWPKYQDTFSTSTVLFRTTTWCYCKLHLIIWRHHGKLPKSYNSNSPNDLFTSLIATLHPVSVMIYMYSLV